MARREILITTSNGRCPATLHLPDRPGPGVILYPDAGGAREVMREMGDRLAALGYVALVPDVYYREGDWAPFDLSTAFGDPEERTRLFAVMGTLTPDRIDADAEAFLDALAQQPEVTGDTVGLTGYCMGGRIALRVAATHASRVAAVASFHGGNLANADDPNSPHHLVGRISGVVLVAAAEGDASFPAEQAQLLEEVLTDGGVRHTVETYPAKHGYAVPDNPTYDELAAERHWQALESLYGGALAI
ncbi:dienelactone hydrolase family protein [Mycobacterium sp. CBMA271]|uniref:dienelactone hydrolase family protein n=1 Tax=unclassified Mycobacteroides TaxID=2618759 RepID=UPI0012DE5E65|nr:MULTISPECIES: dienelactone hydrolase family protein [unclassified Mycobacteroides]MUM19982.1 dienelactone hydrolase [Mycobacteroides sp. CBMA 326]MUM20156.1 dienelactone hydrolase family protein [Mycobacteroides sp. CBMA 271]